MYQIIDRYTPHTVAAMFAGHTHEDQLFLNYANNATSPSASTAKVATWVGPSITPLTGLNSGFRMCVYFPISCKYIMKGVQRTGTKSTLKPLMLSMRTLGLPTSPASPI